MTLVANKSLPDKPYRRKVLRTTVCTTGLVVSELHILAPRINIVMVTRGPLVGVKLTI